MGAKRKKTLDSFRPPFVMMTALALLTTALCVTLCHGDIPLPLARAVFAPAINQSPFGDAPPPTDVPDFHSTQYYLENDDDDQWVTKSSSSSSAKSSTDSPRRRSANPPEVRCALNRTSASLCKSSGTPIGCACDKLCHGE